MSISSALSSANSGLRASSRAAEIVSSNLANMLTPGYATRELELRSLGQGLAGVTVAGVTRQTDPQLLADRRSADAEVASSDTRAQFLGAVEQALGTPDQAFSLSALVADFEARLTAASATPESTASLQSAVQSAGELTQGLNRAAKVITDQREQADAAIASAVTRINSLLGDIRDVNTRLGSTGRQDQYSASLLDQRQALVDELSAYIPVQQVPRENGTAALFTSGGAILLDGNPAELGFEGRGVIAPHMTVENGLLSGLTINGIDVSGRGADSPVQGGRLAALFAIRDELAVGAQNELDAIARDLVERFEQPGLDPSRALGAAGLLTDAGNAFTPADTAGLAARIALNSSVDPAQGGAYWRLRDGLGAPIPGSPGNGQLISGLAAALGAERSLADAGTGAPARSAAGHVNTMTSRIAQDRLQIDRDLSFAAARQAQLAEREVQSGVDSDAELQNLLLIEQSYAANARMIQTIDEMMNALLRI